LARKRRKEFELKEIRMTKARKKKPPRSSAEFSTLDDFLKEQGTFEEFQAIAMKEVLAWQAAEAMKDK
jgi:antitoxin HicB